MEKIKRIITDDDDSNINTNDRPECKKAKNAVNRAVASGEIKKPGICSHCNNIAKVQAHHYKGYDEKNTFDIQWLCRMCHEEAHKKLRKNNDSVNRLDVFDNIKTWLIEPFTKTDEGFLTGRAIVTNTGIFNYVSKDVGILKELRPDEEVFSEESLETLKMIPITNLHPKEPVNSENAKKVQVGFTGSDVRTSFHAVSVDMTITDQKTIDEIERDGKVALSCGYKADLENQSGSAYGNNEYNTIQRRIRYNHVAIVENARAGDLAKIKFTMDSSDAVCINDSSVTRLEKNKGGKTMKKIIIDGIEYEADLEVIKTYNHKAKDYQKLEQKLEDNTKSFKKNFSKVEAERDAYKDKFDASEKKRKEEILTDEIIQKAAKERLSIIENAKLSEVEIKDEMTNIEIKKIIIEKVFPKVDLKDKDEIYLNIRYDFAVETLVEKKEKEIVSDNKKKVFDVSSQTQKNDKNNQKDDSYKDYCQWLQDGWKEEKAS